MATITVEELGAVGVRVRGADRHTLAHDDATSEWLPDLLEAHGVVVLPEVHVDDTVPLRLRSRADRLAAGYDAGVVDDDVDATPGVERGLHDRCTTLGRGDRVGVGDRLAAELAKPGRGLRRRSGRWVVAQLVAADVVDDDLGAAAGELGGVRPAEATARTGHDRDAAIEADLTRCIPHGARHWHTSPARADSPAWGRFVNVVRR